MSTTVTFNISPSTNQLDAIKSSPTNTSASFASQTASTLNNPTDVIERAKVGANYYVTNVLLAFSTGSIPNDATVESATLNLYIKDVVITESSIRLQVEKFLGPVALSSWKYEYLATGSIDLLNITSLEDLDAATGTIVSLPLSNVASAISILAPTTYLRLTLGSVLSFVNPTAYNYVAIPTNLDTISGHVTPTLTVTYSLPLPGPPTNVHVTSVGTTTMGLAWTQPSQGADDFLLDVSTNSSFSSFVGAYNDYSTGDVSSITVTGLSPTTHYYFRLRSVNANGISATYSSTADDITGSATTNKTITDSGTGSDTRTILRTHGLTVTDTGAGSDAVTKATSAVFDKTLTDSGHGIDIVILENSVAKTITDTGRAFESIGDFDYVQIDNYLSYYQSVIQSTALGFSPVKNGSITTSTTSPKEGTYALKVSGAALGDGVALSGLIHVLPNTEYTFSGWYRADTSSQDLALNISMCDANYEVITDLTAPVSTLTTDWQYFRLTFLTGSDVQYITTNIVLDGAGASSFGLDALELRRGSGSFVEALFNATADAFISQIAPNANFGASDTGFIGPSEPGTGAASRYMLKFDVSSVPEDADILQTSLSIFKTAVAQNGPGVLKLYRLIMDWTEGDNLGTTGDTNEVTWNDARKEIMAWGFPGAENDII